MKKSDFIKKVLKSSKNTVFVSEEQVANSLEIFISLGMVAPKYSACVITLQPKELGELDIFAWEDEDE